MSGRATASIVEFSGSSVTAAATAAMTRRSDDADDAGVTIDLDGLAVDDHLRGDRGADHGGHAVLAGDDRGVAQHTAGVRDHRAGGGEQRRPGRGGRLGGEGGAPRQAGGGGCWTYYPARGAGGTP